MRNNCCDGKEDEDAEIKKSLGSQRTNEFTTSRRVLGLAVSVGHGIGFCTVGKEMQGPPLPRVKQAQCRTVVHLYT
jgi:hypothetical protein